MRQGWINITGSRWGWWQNDRQYGWYDGFTDTYRSYNPDTREWGPELHPSPYRPGAVQERDHSLVPVVVETRGPTVTAGGRGVYRTPDSGIHGPPLPDPVVNYGLDLDRIAEGSGYIVDGRPASREEAVRAIEDDRVPDDSNNWRLTAIGNPELIALVRADLTANPEISAKLTFQEYRPTDWVTRRFNVTDTPRFQASGFFLCLQKPDGTAVHGQFEYKAGDLALVAQRFDPLRVPDRRAPVSPDLKSAYDAALLWAKENPTMVLVIIGVVVFFLLQKKGQ